MSDYRSSHEWFRDDVAITDERAAYGMYRTDDRGYHDRQIASSDIRETPWVPRERGGYWRQYQPEQKRTSVPSQPVAGASGKETPSKSTSSSTA